MRMDVWVWGWICDDVNNCYSESIQIPMVVLTLITFSRWSFLIPSYSSWCRAGALQKLFHPAIIWHAVYMICVCLCEAWVAEGSGGPRAAQQRSVMSRLGHRQRRPGSCSASLPIVWLWSNTQILIPVPFCNVVPQVYYSAHKGFTKL